MSATHERCTAPVQNPARGHGQGSRACVPRQGMFGRELPGRGGNRRRPKPGPDTGETPCVNYYCAPRGTLQVIADIACAHRSMTVPTHGIINSSARPLIPIKIRMSVPAWIGSLLVASSKYMSFTTRR